MNMNPSFLSLLFLLFSQVCNARHSGGSGGQSTSASGCSVGPPVDDFMDCLRLGKGCPDNDSGLCYDLNLCRDHGEGCEEFDLCKSSYLCDESVDYRQYFCDFSYDGLTTKTPKEPVLCCRTASEATEGLVCDSCGTRVDLLSGEYLPVQDQPATSKRHCLEDPQYQYFQDLTTGTCTQITAEMRSEAQDARSNPPFGSNKNCEVNHGAFGDPHIVTWSGGWFDYMGECDLVLAHVSDFVQGKSLDIHIRTKIRYDYSFIEDAAIKIGNDILEVGPWGNYAVNGVDSAYLGGKAGRLSGFPLYHTQVNKKRHSFDVVISPSQNITLSSFKDIVAVLVHGESHVEKAVGLMGSFGGKLLARDGKTDMSKDKDAFGNEWQVREDEPKLFRAPRSPQHPHEQCVLPTTTDAKPKRRLGEGISREAAAKACAHVVSQSHKESCISDVVAFGDVELAEAIAY